MKSVRTKQFYAVIAWWVGREEQWLRDMNTMLSEREEIEARLSEETSAVRRDLLATQLEGNYTAVARHWTRRPSTVYNPSEFFPLHNC